MKNPFNLSAGNLAAVLFFTAIACFLPGRAQDTLHLNYIQTQTKLNDSSDVKISQWIKKLAGQHQNLKVLAYYSQSDYKKFAIERADELFLILNRKARSLFTIDFIGPQKGEKSQRSRVDIVYSTTGATPKPAEKTAAKKDDKKEEKTADKKEEKPEVADQKKESKKKEPKEPKKEKDNEKPAVAEDKKKEKGKKDNKKEVAETKSDSTAVKEDAEDDTQASAGNPKTKHSNGGLLKAKEVKQIKEAKVIIAQTDDKSDNAALENAVKNFWNFTSDVAVMPYNEAKALAAKDEKVVIFVITRVKLRSALSKSLAQAVVEEISITPGNAVMILNGKGGILASQYIPAYGEDVTPEAVAFGVEALNYQLKVMDEKQMSSNMKFKSAYKLHSEELKLKTLYIPENWLNKTFDKAKIAEIYKGKAEVVSFNTWKDAVLNKKEDVAYVIISPMPIPGQATYTYIHYLMDAQTGMVYAMCYPKVGMSMGTPIGGVNVLKSNNGQIQEKNIKKYNDAISGDW